MDPPDESRESFERRTRLYRRARIAVVALVIAYFFLPYGIRAWIPVWLPFGAALALELQFFVGGYRAAREGRPSMPSASDRGPQPHDLEELGGDRWRNVYGFEGEDGIDLVPEDALTESDPPPDPEEEDDEDFEPAPRAPRRSFARHLPETAFAIAIVAGILFVAIRPHGWSAISSAKQARAEAVFSREASAIARHPAQVVCDTKGEHVGTVQDADGAAIVGGNTAYLVPSLCDHLYQLEFRNRVQSFSQTARAIAVLAHEAWHLHGVADEGLANCYAFQSGVRVGRNLGLTESRARAMMREQLATNTSDSGANTAYIVPADCRDGGQYDLNPGSGQFP
jgi:hypothetical protein